MLTVTRERFIAFLYFFFYLKLKPITMLNDNTVTCQYCKHIIDLDQTDVCDHCNISIFLTPIDVLTIFYNYSPLPT